MSDYISEKIEQYERKLKQAEKAGKHNNYPGRVRTLQELFSLVKRPLKREIDDGAKVKKNPVTLALRKARKARIARGHSRLRTRRRG